MWHCVGCGWLPDTYQRNAPVPCVLGGASKRESFPSGTLTARCAQPASPRHLVRGIFAAFVDLHQTRASKRERVTHGPFVSSQLSPRLPSGSQESRASQLGHHVPPKLQHSPPVQALGGPAARLWSCRHGSGVYDVVTLKGCGREAPNPSNASSGGRLLALEERLTAEHRRMSPLLPIMPERLFRGENDGAAPAHSSPASSPLSFVTLSGRLSPSASTYPPKLTGQSSLTMAALLPLPKLSPLPARLHVCFSQLTLHVAAGTLALQGKLDVGVLSQNVALATVIYNREVPQFPKSSTLVPPRPAHFVHYDAQTHEDEEA